LNSTAHGAGAIILSDFSCFACHLNLKRENIMSDHHHHEDPSVCYRVALVFIGVIALIAILAVFN
jgi:hypothetical protein